MRERERESEDGKETDRQAERKIKMDHVLQSSAKLNRIRSIETIAAKISSVFGATKVQ